MYVAKIFFFIPDGSENDPYHDGGDYPPSPESWIGEGAMEHPQGTHMGPGGPPAPSYE